MEIWELVARESVRDLVQRYNANGDSGRFDCPRDRWHSRPRTSNRQGRP